MGLDAEGPAAAAADSGGFGAKAANGTLRPTESAAHNTEYLMNMGYDKVYAEVIHIFLSAVKLSGIQTALVLFFPYSAIQIALQ